MNIPHSFQFPPVYLDPPIFGVSSENGVRIWFVSYVPAFPFFGCWIKLELLQSQHQFRYQLHVSDQKKNFLAGSWSGLGPQHESSWPANKTASWKSSNLCLRFQCLHFSPSVPWGSVNADRLASSTALFWICLHRSKDDSHLERCALHVSSCLKLFLWITRAFPVTSNICAEVECPQRALVLKCLDLEAIFNLLEGWGAEMGKPAARATFLLYSPLESSYEELPRSWCSFYRRLVPSHQLSFLEPSFIMDSSRLCGLSRLKEVSGNASDFESRGQRHGLEITFPPYMREEQVSGMGRKQATWVIWPSSEEVWRGAGHWHFRTLLCSSVICMDW